MDNKYTLQFLFTFLMVFGLANIEANGQTEWSKTTGETSVFSSARTADLNNDGIKDFVIGGGLESFYTADGSIIQYDSDHMIMAINGATGDWLWQVPGNDQIYGSPIFKDVTGDFIPDVFIGGRNGLFFCIDGSNGAVNWQFYEGSNTGDASVVGLYNFFNGQWIADQNGDGIEEILIANGGDRRLPSWETDRPAGKLMVINPVNGELLASAEMPDGKETYMSPVVNDFFRDRQPDVIFGTGGETISGNLYRVPLSDLMAGDISNATVLYTTANKGFIAPPSLADLNGDNIPEIITNTYEGNIIANDGWTNEVLWNYTVGGAETNASPAIGLFNNDDIPDVFTSFLIGVAPSYSDVKQLLIDGATGNLIKEYSLGDLQYSSPVVYDTNSDGIDEAITMINNAGADGFSHDIIAFDFTNDTQTSLLDAPIPGTNIASTPWIGNLDNDGTLDMFYAHNANGSSFNSTDSFVLKRHSLAGITDTNAVAWSGYMGNEGDGFYDNPNGTCYQSLWFLSTVGIPPTCVGGSDGEADIASNGCPCMFNDCQFLWSNGDTSHHATNLIPDRYYVTIIHEDGCVMVTRVDVPENQGPELALTNNNCFGESTGSASVVNINDTIPYLSYTWSTGETTPTIQNLAAGTYSVTLVSPVGCEDETVEFVIEEPQQLAVGNLDFGVVGCNGVEEGFVQISATGGQAPYTLFLFGGDESYTDSFDDLLTVEDVGLGDFEYILSDASGCSTITGEFVISEAVAFTQTTNVQNINCMGDIGAINVSLAGGIPPFNYSLNGIATGSSDAVSFTIDNLDAGTYGVEIFDANGCSVLFAETISEAPQMNVDFIPTNASTDQSTDGSVGVVVSGGTPPYMYTFAGQSGSFEANVPTSVADIAAGDYVLTITDANDCSLQFEVPVGADEVTSLTDLVLEQITLYPNPSTGQFVLNTSQLNDAFDINVYNALGQKVQFGTKVLTGGDTQIVLPSAKAGIYFVSVGDETANKLIKLFVY